MILRYIELLPPFAVENLSNELVRRYFAQLPRASSLTADVLSDGIGFDDDKPFIENELLVVPQNLINTKKLNVHHLDNLLKVLNYIDFKYALLLFLQLRDGFKDDVLLQKLEQQDTDIFLNRLNVFLSVFVAEFLCINEHDTLL